MHGSERWLLKQQYKHKMATVGSCMLRWMYGNKRMDKIRNEHIRQKFHVALISETRRKGAQMVWP